MDTKIINMIIKKEIFLFWITNYKREKNFPSMSIFYTLIYTRARVSIGQDVKSKSVMSLHREKCPSVIKTSTSIAVGVVRIYMVALFTYTA